MSEKEFESRIETAQIEPLSIIYFFWQMGLIDGLSLFQYCFNGAIQYGAIVISASAGNFSQISPKVVLEPIVGIAIGVKYATAAATAVERRQRILTLAAFLSTSAAVLTTDPTTSAAVGGAVASKISYMRAILARGGAAVEIINPYVLLNSENYIITVDSIKSKIHPYRTHFTAKCKLTINQMFQEQTAHRYFQASAEKVKMVGTTYLVPIVSNQITTTAFVGWTFLGVGIIGFTTLGALVLFQRAERNRYKNKNYKDQVLIDVTDSFTN